MSRPGSVAELSRATRARRHTRVAAGVALALVAVLGVMATADGPPLHAQEVIAPAAAGDHRWVTLVTGDKVLVRITGTAKEVVTVRPAKGREGAKFLQRSERGDRYVVPADVAPLVAAGRVDRRLFNVSKLVDQGYDDRGRADVPLIVTYAGGASAASVGLRTAGAQLRRALRTVSGDAVTVQKATTSGFWKAVHRAGSHTLAGGVSQVWLDGRAEANLDRSVPQIGAPAAWQAGHTGKGAKVAVLDTGVDTGHPDLAGAVTAAQDFTGSPSGTDDRYGHGTHVAGIITGSGAAAPDTKYRGVAPDATILNGKVLGDDGSGQESWIIAGMEWAVSQGADVVNLSLGSALPSDGTDPMSQAVNRLTRDSGTLFVVSSGNTGPDDTTVGSPGAADEALTVGAVDRADKLADFSSRGPRLRDTAVKPEITAPGVDIVAPLADGALLGEYEPVVDGRYLQLSGTSMAAPHVAGAAAILAAQHPDWKADRIKPALTGSAARQPDATVYEQGAGRVDVARAVTQPVTVTPASVNFGVQRWPHTDDTPVSKVLTYRNDGTAAVTLELTVAAHDRAGNPAPPGMFTVDSDRVTVPAGGTAAVTLVADTRGSAPDGTYGAVVTATGGEVTLHTPAGVDREVESYDVTMSFVDRDGRPTPEYWAEFVDVVRPGSISPFDPSGKAVVRVPKGRYHLEAEVYTPDGSPTGAVTFVVEPNVVVDRDMTMVVDARQGTSPGVTVDQPNARTGSAYVSWARTIPWTSYFNILFLTNFEGVYFRPSQTAAPGDEFTFQVGARLAEPDGAGGFAGSPYLYHTMRQHTGRVPSDLVKHIGDDELGKVHTRIAAPAPGWTALKDNLLAVTAPAKLTEFYSPGYEWRPSLVRPRPDGEGFDQYIESAPVTYQAGKTTTERWNVGVFGPSLATSLPSKPWVARSGDAIVVRPQLYGDQAPHRFGAVTTDSMRLSLYRDGQQVGESPQQSAVFEVPADSASYRLTADATQQLMPLSTKVSAAWTFRSGHTGKLATLPLLAVRYAPPLDDHNRAEAGKRFTFPVYVQQQSGAAYGTLTQLTVRVSYDDGTSWQPVSLSGEGAQRIAVVQHPMRSGFVSLHATAIDSDGNKVEQTIIRAYALHI